MANELKHASQGTSLTQAEFEAVGLHVFNSQATGDILYASSSTQLTRLGITANSLLGVSGGLPAWTSSLPTQVDVTDGFTIGLDASSPAPDQKGVHIWGGTSGAQTAPTNTLLTLEKDSDLQVAFLVGDAHSCYMRFQPMTTARAGVIQYLTTASPSMRFYVANTHILEFNAGGDITWVTSSDSSSVADEVTIGGYEIGAGNRVLAISQETAVASEADETKFSHKMQCRINGATYYMMLTQS